MRYFIINFVFLFFLGSCFVSDGVNYSDIDVMNVINRYSKSIAIEKKAIRRSYGLDYAGRDNIYDGKIHVIALSYSVDKNMNYEEAKCLFYEIVDGLLDVINKTEYLGKYFYHTPIGYEDLCFSLTFDYDQKGTLKKDEVYRIAIFENQIYYHLCKGEKPIQMSQKKIFKGLYLVDGFFPDTRTIIRDLPEKEI
jgi:hypothetical protein